MAMGSCVKLSVNCYLRLTFGWHLNQHLINTQRTLSWHSINVLIDTRSTVRSQVLIDSSVLIDTQWHVCKNQSTLNQLLTKMLLIKWPLCVNQGVNQISIKCWSRVLIDTRSQIPLEKKCQRVRKIRSRKRDEASEGNAFNQSQTFYQIPQTFPPPPYSFLLASSQLLPIFFSPLRLAPSSLACSISPPGKGKEISALQANWALIYSI